MTKFSSAPVAKYPDTERSPDSLAPSIGGVGGAIVRVTDLESDKGDTMQAIDMRGQTVNEVKIRLAEMAGDDLVMRGSNGALELIEEFDPAQSNLAGKKQSVYATDDPETALFNAILNKHGSRAVALRMLDGGYGASSNMVIKIPGKSNKFAVPEHMAEAIQEAYAAGAGSKEWDSLFGDGVVYLMSKDKFSQDSPLLDGSPEETDHEWNSQQKVVSEFAVTVSPELIKDVLRFDGDNANVEIIPVDEADVLDGFKRDMEAVIPEGKLEFSADELMAMAQGSKERMEFAKLLKQRIGPGSLPKEEFAKKAAEFYEERVKELSKA